MLVKRRYTKLISFLSALLASPTPISFASSLPSPLPSPISLQQALQISQQNHPSNLIATSRVEYAQAQVQQAKAESSLEIFLNLDAYRVKNSVTNLYYNDSRVHLGARQLLFDFGVSSATINQHQYSANAQIHLQKTAKIRHQINTEQAYYDVLLADLRYSADNEIMTVAYLRYDKVRHRHDLGIFSDLDLARAEYDYLKLLNIRKNAEISQRITRQKLAILLNRPNEVPSELIMPQLRFTGVKVPDINEYYQRSLRTNPLIKSMQEFVKSKRAAAAAEKNRIYPIISAELNLSEYQRERVYRNDVTFALQLQLPLYQSGLQKAKSTQAITDLRSATAQLNLAKLQLQQNILESAMQIEALQIQKNTAEKELDFREFDLDKRRAEYELELQTNMGSALANMTLAQWRATKINLDIELSWKKLNALLGSSSELSPEEITP